MASVEKRGNSWRLIAYLGYDELGKQIVRRKTISADGFSKAEAKRMAAAFESSLTKNTLRDTGSMTVSDFIAYWWDNYGNTQSVTTIRRNKELLVRIEGMLGHIKLSKLAPKHILLMIKQLQKKDARLDGKGALSSRTIAMHYKLLSSMLNRAVRWQFVENNACSFVDTPKQKTKPQPILQEKDLARFLHLLLTTAPLRHQCFFMFAFTDGLRRSEIAGIDESAIDFDNGTLKIITTAVIGEDGNVIYKDETKTRESAATMYIAPTTLEITKQYIAEKKANESALHLPHCTKLFTHVDGTPIRPQAFTKWLHKFCERHNIPKVNTQSFRKMAITYALGKVNLKEASVFGRHTDIQTTSRYYTEVLQSRMATPTKYLNDLVEQAIESEGAYLELDKKGI